MNIKESLYNCCLEFVENRLKVVQNKIKEIQESLTSETKSSAGDKHETGRAMLQLEREKAGFQLAEILKTKEQLSKILINKTQTKISLGSVVYTSKNNYFIAVSAGALHVGEDLFYAISPNTPIGKLLMGKAVGESIAFKDAFFKITKIV